MKLSIIICVYNTPKNLLKSCLDSIANSTLFLEKSHTGAEIVVIDDGSDTDYSNLLAEYGVKYTKTENRGIFEARALGVTQASGDYVAFVDSDDTVSFNYHLPMLNLALEKNLDVVINDWAYHTESSRYYTDADSTIVNDISLEGEKIINAFLRQAGREHSYYVLWNKLYKRKLLSSAIEMARAAAVNIKRYNYAEDVLINFYAHLNAKRLSNLHTGYYFYRIHPTQTVSVTNEEKLKLQIDLMSFTLGTMESKINKLSAPNLSLYLKSWRSFISRSHYTHAKSGRFKSLYPYIKEKYGVERLKRSTYADEICGMRCIPLPDNFTDIDAALFESYKNSTIPNAEGINLRYVTNTLRYFDSLGFSQNDNAKTLPKPKIPFKKKVRFNKLLMRVARILFPKGSRIRAYLKRYM